MKREGRGGGENRKELRIERKRQKKKSWGRGGAVARLQRASQHAWRLGVDLLCFKSCS